MTVPHPVPTDHIAPEDVLRKWPKTPEKGGYNTDFPCGCKFYHDFGRALTPPLWFPGMRKVEWKPSCTIKNFMPCPRHQHAPIAYSCGCHIDSDEYCKGRCCICALSTEGEHNVEGYRKHKMKKVSDYRRLDLCLPHAQYLYEVHW